MTDEAYRTEHFGLDERTAQSARDVMDILVETRWRSARWIWIPGNCG
ncbi:MAG: hypothetical protein ACLS6G_12015 [Christensenellales bacterium]